jgi:D-arabinose 5-phosphate isomerase GutQ
MPSASKSEILKRAREVVLREAEGVRLLADQLDEGLSDILEIILHCKGHVLVIGAGTSRAIAQRLAHLLSCSGTPALFISASDGLHGGSGAVTSNDVVYVISKGGKSSEINEFAAISKSRGARIVAQTENPDSPLAKMSDVVYMVKAIGDVDPFGMVATGSSLVNGAAGDVLCVLLLGLRGYSREQFGETHPGGAVGEKIEELGE